MPRHEEKFVTEKMMSIVRSKVENDEVLSRYDLMAMFGINLHHSDKVAAMCIERGYIAQYIDSKTRRGVNRVLYVKVDKNKEVKKDWYEGWAGAKRLGLEGYERYEYKGEINGLQRTFSKIF